MIEIYVCGNAGEAVKAQNIIETEVEGYFPVQKPTPRKWVGSIKIPLEQRGQPRTILHKIVSRIWASKQPCVFTELRSIFSTEIEVLIPRQQAVMDMFHKAIVQMRT